MEVEAEGSKIQSHPQMHHEFNVRLPQKFFFLAQNLRGSYQKGLTLFGECIQLFGNIFREVAGRWHSASKQLRTHDPEKLLFCPCMSSFPESTILRKWRLQHQILFQTLQMQLPRFPLALRSALSFVSCCSVVCALRNLTFVDKRYNTNIPKFHFKRQSDPIAEPPGSQPITVF